MKHTPIHSRQLLSAAAALVSAQLVAATAFSGSAHAASFLNPFTLKPAVVVAPAVVIVPAAKFTMTPAPVVVPSGGDSPQTVGGQPTVIPPNTSNNPGSTTPPSGTANAGTVSTTPGSTGSGGTLGGGGFTTSPGAHPPGQS